MQDTGKALLMAMVLIAPSGVLGQPLPTAVVSMLSTAEAHGRTLVLRGRTEADRRVDVRAEEDGLIAAEAVRRGSRVSRGDVLCRLADAGRPADLAEARASLIRAEAEYEAAQRLSERGFTAQTEALSRLAALEAARAQLMRAELATQRLEIRAPFDGVLEEDSAALGTLLRPGDLCATVTAIDPIVLVGYAPEREVDRIALGMAATARLVTGREIAGTVRFVARSAEPETRTFRVEVAVPNSDLAIRDGLTAEIAVRLDGVEAHRLPQSALTLGDDGALGVRVARDGYAQFHHVQLIDESAEGMWVTGLPETAEVIVVGQEFVADGSPVTTTLGVTQ
jgi:multidrug efflux system membrane fusion protein